MSDPYRDRKRVHKAHKFGPGGRVSPLCADPPRALNLRVATWTLTDRFVTCPKCRKSLEVNCGTGESNTARQGEAPAISGVEGV